MELESKRVSIFSLLGWGIIAALLICGFAVPSWILWQQVYRSNQNGIETAYRLMLPITVTTLWPLLLTHLYWRRFASFVRWEIWFGAIQIIGWATTSWALTWMLNPNRLDANGGRAPSDFAYGCVVFCFAVWIFIPIIACTGLATINGIGRWWRKRKQKTTEPINADAPGVQRKPITIKTIGIWIAIVAAGLSLNLSGGVLAKEVWEKINHREALWVLFCFLVISLISVLVYGLLNVWLKKVRPYVLGWLFLVTFFPTLPLWTPVRFSRQGNFVEVEALTILCFLFFLTACLVIVFRVAIHWISPAKSVGEVTGNPGKRSKLSTAFGGLLFTGVVSWIIFLAVCPITQFLLRSDAGSPEAIHRHMVSVFDGEADDRDWLDSLNRNLGHGLAPENNAVVDLVELNLSRLGILKNADRGMESIREYFQLLGVEQNQIDQWCDQIAELELSEQGIHEVGRYPVPGLVKFVQEEVLNAKSQKNDVSYIAPNDDDPPQRSSYMPDWLEDVDIQRLRKLYSTPVKDESSPSVSFATSAGEIVVQIPDQLVINGFLQDASRFADRTPWRDEDFPPGARYLVANKQYLDSLRQLSRKDVYSPWIRLKDQPYRENYVFSDSQRPYNPLLLLRIGESILNISAMNHAGNKNFEAAINDLESLARLHDRSWLPGFTLPTDGSNRLAYPTEKVMDLALVLACHPEFPAELSESLLAVNRMLVMDVGRPPPALINIRSNLIADRFYRSGFARVKWDRIYPQTENDPLFRLCMRYPDLVDWQVFAGIIDQKRRDAIEQYEEARKGNLTEDIYSWELIPITKTHFQELFLTGPKGKARALPALFRRNVHWDLSFWTSHYMRSLRLKQTALFVELYRQKYGSYPEQLEDLSPEFTSSVAQAPYSNQGLVYQKKDESYTLYSVDRNGVDDGGDLELDLVFERPAVDLFEAIKQNRQSQSR